MLSQQGHQLTRIFEPSIWQDDQRNAVQQGGENLPDRIHKIERGFLGADLAFSKGIDLLHPIDAVQRRGVPARHAFGDTGGARSVEHVREIDARLVGGVGLRLTGNLGVVVETDDVSLNRQHTADVGLGQHQRQPSVLRHVGQAFARIGRIQGDIDAPGFENAQETHHHVNRALSANPNRHLRPHPQPPQVMGHLVGATVQHRES